MQDVDGLNAGFARALLEQYLENPEAVPAEWRSLFESGSSEGVANHPGLVRLLALAREDGNAHLQPPPEVEAAPEPPPAPAPPPEPAPAPEPVATTQPALDNELLGGVAAPASPRPGGPT